MSTSGPPLAKMTEGGRFYQWNNEQYPSVTSILNALSKPALVKWAAAMTAERAVDMSGDLPDMIDKHGRDRVVRILADAPNEGRDRAASTGSEVHDYIEQRIAGQDPVPDQKIAGFAKSWAQFMDDYQPRFSHSECTVFNRTHAYAGTLDAVCQIGEEQVMLDVKSGNGIYGTVALQLAAYRNGEFIGHPNGIDELEVPRITRAAVLHIRPRGYKLVEVDVSPQTFRFFLCLSQIYHWQTQIGDDSLLGPYQVPS